MHTRSFTCIFGAVALVLTATAANAADEAAFFVNKTLTYVVATAPGGGYDTYGRLVAEYMGKKIPGVTAVVRNVPGGGHIIGANLIYASAPDGLTIGTFNTGLSLNQLTRSDGIKFDLAKMSWIGKAASDPRVLLVSKQSAEIKSLADLRRGGAPLLFAANVADDPETKVLIPLLKLNGRLLPGYRGDESLLAMRRGEIDANYSSYSANREFVSNGYGWFAFAVGGDVPDVPQLRDIITDDSEETRSLVALLQAQAEIARLTAGPPAIPVGRLALLRRAYKEALEDPEMRAKAQKMKLPLDPAYGEEVMEMMLRAVSLPAEHVDRFVSLVRAK
jgi:hypothetical protein